jgi:soluble lytic murein transglycosylase-like protein
VTWFLVLLLAQSKDTFQSAIAKQRAAAEIQREATRKQAEAVARYFASESVAVDASADCDPIPDPYASAILGYAATTHQLEPKLLRALILQESGFRPCAVSTKGAQGLMQLMPATAQQFGVTDAMDPKQNVDAGAKYLKQLLDKYKGDVPLALAAYNAGPNAVDNAGGVPEIKETRDYVEAIARVLGISPKPRSPPQIQMPKPIEN